ncbi:MAG: undecaprenyldiphospho-muramoylpentapeptide beta-N-acetylglucosaminyltransferase [Prevotellaceae bacterium]|jgi:UDP-N-acetylglucosamine--N-acetylmuramyl-(pentapeptide) pyrophosphoryl-undecaprenol N-acetylglucosamine transferase|nr:undecaprenyldiphospho-muramoylpentapeptide beta-N-acetylglucosaminyltransferase [Prevotellaceae bacterium]
MSKKLKFLISGGGTGGHIFPAISIANALQEAAHDCQILFIGANNRLEMQRIPEVGYNIVGLNMQGIERKKVWKNFSVVANFVKSCLKARKIVKNFAPDVAIGVGGYVSGAAIWAASSLGVPVVLQEQNSFAGVTNKFLARKALKICVAYPNMEKFFNWEKIVITGNPVRQNILNQSIDKELAYREFGLQSEKKTLLVIGGSLGAKTINQSILENIEKIYNSDIQVIWQTGKFYFNDISQKIGKSDNIFVSDFILRMDYAYAIADLVISRAGASSISELCLLGKPVILVPSPNVAENHQYHNAMVLAEKFAAVLVEDSAAAENLLHEALNLIHNDQKLNLLHKNIQTLALKDSAQKIAQEVMKIVMSH